MRALLRKQVQFVLRYGKLPYGKYGKDEYRHFHRRADYNGNAILFVFIDTYER